MCVLHFWHKGEPFFLDFNRNSKCIIATLYLLAQRVRKYLHVWKQIFWNHLSLLMKIKRLTLTTMVSGTTRIVLTIFATLLKSKERVNITLESCVCCIFDTREIVFSYLLTEIASTLSRSIVKKKHEADRCATLVRLTVQVPTTSEDMQLISLNVAWTAGSLPTGLVQFMITSYR